MAQILAHIGSARAAGIVSVFSRALDSGAPEEVQQVSNAIRAIAAMTHDPNPAPASAEEASFAAGQQS
jgi:hypothetical protein